MSHWYRGFPQCPGCKMPLELCFCGRGPVIIAKEAERLDALSEVGRELWRKLFVEVHTPNDLHSWEQKIPNYDCKCRAFYDAWKDDNPPIFTEDRLAFEWKWSLKSAVNQKLGHADLTLEAARSFWSTQVHATDATA